ATAPRAAAGRARARNHFIGAVCLFLARRSGSCRRRKSVLREDAAVLPPVLVRRAASPHRTFRWRVPRKCPRGLLVAAIWWLQMLRAHHLDTLPICRNRTWHRA